MLTYADDATIRNAIFKRLGREKGFEIADIKIINKPDEKPPHIQVGIWGIIRDRVQDTGLIDTRSFFDLPAEFTHRHLLNEIDECCEQVKEARKKTSVGRILWMPGKTQPREALKGTGLRGHWGDDAPKVEASK